MRFYIFALACLFTSAALGFDDSDEYADDLCDDCYEEDQYDDFALSGESGSLSRGKKVRVLSCAKARRKVAEQRALNTPSSSKERTRLKQRFKRHEKGYVLHDHRKNKDMRTYDKAQAKAHAEPQAKAMRSKNMLVPLCLFSEEGKCQIYVVRLKTKQGCGLQCLGASKNASTFMRIAPGTIQESFNR